MFCRLWVGVCLLCLLGGGGTRSPPQLSQPARLPSPSAISACRLRPPAVSARPPSPQSAYSAYPKWRTGLRAQLLKTPPPPPPPAETWCVCGGTASVPASLPPAETFCVVGGPPAFALSVLDFPPPGRDVCLGVGVGGGWGGGYKLIRTFFWTCDCVQRVTLCASGEDY